MSDALESVQDAPQAIVEEVIEENLSESVNPFTLSEDHEFKAPEPAKIEPMDGISYEQMGLQPTTAPTYGGINRTPPPDSPPAFPGTPESDYRRCPCIGVMPGRACMRCHNSKWVKTCPKCEGEMFVSAKVRKGAHARTERCGFCMGLGQVAARLDEVRAAEEAAKAYRASGGAGNGIVARGPQLPGTRMSSQERREAKAAQVKAANQRRFHGKGTKGASKAATRRG